MTVKYACPCSCRRPFTASRLAVHLIQLGEASVKRWEALYRKSGMAMPAAAKRETRSIFADLYTKAVDQ